MVAQWLQQLLVLQERDSRCDAIVRQVEDIPRQIAAEEAHIRQLEAELAAREQELRQLEVRRLDLEGEVRVAEAAIVRYKTQQLQVKKNEEYAALEHEIHALKARVSELEDSELLLLEQIDQKQAQLAEVRAAKQAERRTLEAHIERLRQNHAAALAELAAARHAVAACENGIAAGLLQQYRYVKSQVKRPPVVVPLEEGRCMGCHLRVSSEVESLARKGADLVRCDSCGRILYFDR